MNPITTQSDKPSSASAILGADHQGNVRPTRGTVPQSLEAAALPDALLKIQTVSTVTGLSASSIFRKVAAKQFPAPVRMGKRCTRWRSASVRDWVASQVAG